MDKVAYIKKFTTKKVVESEINSVIKSLDDLNGKEIGLTNIRNLAIKFDVIEGILPAHTISEPTKQYFNKALKAMRKIENAVIKHGTIKVEIEAQGLGNLSTNEETALEELRNELKKQTKKSKDAERIFTKDRGGNPKYFIDHYYKEKEKADKEIERLLLQIEALEAKAGIKSKPKINKPSESLLPNEYDSEFDYYRYAQSLIEELREYVVEKGRNSNKRLTIQKMEKYLDAIHWARFENNREGRVGNSTSFENEMMLLANLLASSIEKLKSNDRSYIHFKETDPRNHQEYKLRIENALIVSRQKTKNSPIKSLTPKANEDRKPKPEQTAQPNKGGCFAEEIPIGKIHTDPSRFQNRNTAFSEQSAESVANNYDPNKFDPITVWLDPNDGRLYVLSGHSRLEGMHRRKEKKIPVKYFSGTEADAIQFARIDANRSATEESLLEDLKAYKLMRDGDKRKKIEPSTKKDLRASFKGKVNKLEKLSHLDSTGPFIRALAVEDTSEYPHIGRFAQWVGELKSELKFSSGKEDQIFSFIYSDKILKIAKMDKNDFDKLIRERLASGKDKIFDCNNGECDEPKELEEFLKNKTEAQLRKRLLEIEKTKDKVRSRFTTSNNFEKIHTPEEKTIYRQLVDDLDKEAKEINKQLNKADNTGSALFGTRRKRK